jgi:uncharacterized protein YggT (Ycf19 family)
MDWVDLILNVAGVLLWLSWRTAKPEPLPRNAAGMLAGTLKRAEPARLHRWHFPAALAALLLVRAVFYWLIGSAVGWTPKLPLIVMSVSFRSDFFVRMLLYSALSFGVVLAVFYLGLLLLSIVNRPSRGLEFTQRLVRLNLGRLDGLPWWAKLMLPLVSAILMWLALNPLLAAAQIIPPAVSIAHQFEQGALIGLGAYLTWKYLIGGLLALHLVNSYIYLGNHSFWNFVNLTAQNLLAPLRRLPLRFRKIDFSPLVGIALVFALANLAELGLVRLYWRLPG